MITVVLIGVLVVHGIAHLPGFLVPWQLITTTELPYRTTIFAGRLDLGDFGVRAYGLGWAAMAVIFVTLAWVMWSGTPLARPLIAGAVVLSLLLCLAGWPDTRIGVIANVLILALLAGARS